MGNISIIQGDITKARVDAIVNAANPKMLGGGGVDGAIHKAAGPKLLEACRRVKATNGIRCPFGEARITEAGNLNARYVIHTVGPRYKIDESPEELLKSAYIKSLALAIDNDCKSVAFPAISCGAYGYPISDAAIVAFDICGSKEYSKLSVYFYLFGTEITDVWKQILSKSNT